MACLSAFCHTTPAPQSPRTLRSNPNKTKTTPVAALPPAAVAAMFVPTVASRSQLQSRFEGRMGNDYSQIARRCERAVVTAYRDLREHGLSDLEAFTACTTLYRIHHPEASISEARRLVAEWIDHHVVRHASGPTPGCNCPAD